MISSTKQIKAFHFTLRFARKINYRRYWSLAAADLHSLLTCYATNKKQ